MLVILGTHPVFLTLTICSANLLLRQEALELLSQLVLIM
jgi:hypothetical protein